jgi:glycine cleavage system H protein
MNVPKNLRYTKEHEWALIEGKVATIGITEYAQGELGDIVFVQLPAVGQKTEQFKACANIEAVKAVSDLFAPVSGSVTAVNNDLSADPQLINKDPFGKGWILKVELSNPKEADSLLAPEDYQALIH